MRVENSASGTETVPSLVPLHRCLPFSPEDHLSELHDGLKGIAIQVSSVETAATVSWFTSLALRDMAVQREGFRLLYCTIWHSPTPNTQAMSKLCPRGFLSRTISNSSHLQSDPPYVLAA